MGEDHTASRAKIDSGGQVALMGERRHESFRVSGNKHGYRGVELDRARGLFRAYIWPKPGERGRCLGRFGTAAEAARAYDEAARKLYGVHARLNFPGPGELATVQSRAREGVCPRGHDLSEVGYVRPDGRGTNCRLCQRESARRSYQKRTAALSPLPELLK